MSVGWLGRLMIEHTTKQMINETIVNIDRILQDNPHLTMEEALKVIDKKRCIFFPGEEEKPSDLKSLFMTIVWKSYRYKRFSDPRAASPEHRDVVFKTVHHYLNRENLNEVKSSSALRSGDKSLFKRVMNPVLLGMALVIIVIGGVFVSFHAGILEGVGFRDTKIKSTPQNDIFLYRGYIATEDDVSALVNKTIYHVGDLLGEKDQYILKSIHPKYIVLQKQKDKEDFVVTLRNR